MDTSLPFPVASVWSVIDPADLLGQAEEEHRAGHWELQVKDR